MGSSLESAFFAYQPPFVVESFRWFISVGHKTFTDQSALAARNDVGRQVSFDPLVSDTADNVTHISHASAPIRVREEF